MPRPKVNILHRGLERIANVAGFGDLTEQGFTEFLDDICPCGLRSHREAVRKTRKRAAFDSLVDVPGPWLRPIALGTDRAVHQVLPLACQPPRDLLTV